MPLACENIHFAYPGGPAVLQGVGDVFESGAVTGIVGPNGAGKSTLLRILCGSLTQRSGTVRLGDRPLEEWRPRARAARLAYLSQRPVVSAPFSVCRVVGLGRYARPSLPDAAARALGRVDLADRANDPFGALSVGQQQRAGLARVLAQLDGGDVSPSEQVILADEPCSALDPPHALGAMSLFRQEAARGRAVVLVLHDLTMASRFCDRALVLDGGGRVASVGPVAETLTPETLQRVFGTRFEHLRGAESTALVPVTGGSGTI